jgi:hypothetical protein
LTAQASAQTLKNESAVSNQRPLSIERDDVEVHLRLQLRILSQLLSHYYLFPITLSFKLLIIQKIEKICFGVDRPLVSSVAGAVMIVHYNTLKFDHVMMKCEKNGTVKHR